MKTKKRQRVPAPFNKWVTLKTWKKIPASDRKLMTDLIKLQNSLHRKYYKNRPPEEYVNMNAEIEYERYNGLR